MMLFSEYVDSVKIPEFVKDKVKGKEFARSLGIATAKVFNPPGAFIIKPVHGHSARGIVLADSRSTIVEELLADADGSTPPMDYRFHCFHGRARLMQLTKTDRVGGSLVHDFRLYPSFEDIEVCRYPSKKLPISPEVAHEMAVLAEVVSQAARIPYLRVDFYNTTRGIFWGEACVTPGFAVSTNRKISPTADALLGSWITASTS